MIAIMTKLGPNSSRIARAFKTQEEYDVWRNNHDGIFRGEQVFNDREDAPEGGYFLLNFINH
jgi:hypothetical protein